MNYKKTITTLLSVVVLVSGLVMPIRADETYPTEGSGGFITRLYEMCLDREPDASGYDYWTTGLNNKTQSGASLAYNFIFSSEFQSKNFSNEDYIEHMYALVLGRASDPDGKAYWVDRLNSGSSRLDIFYGFVRSSEFDGLCNSYGIDTSTWKVGDNYSKRQFVDCFVQRLYVTCLDRNSDISGLAYWSDCVMYNGLTGSDLSYSFFNSAEYKNSNKTDEAYLRDLYQAMMGRNADDDGLAYWLNVLASGATRGEVFDGFANSKEFSEICSEYGVTKGNSDHKPQPAKPFDPNTSHTMEEWMEYQGISQYTTKEGIVVYGKYIDTTPLNNKVQEYRASLGLPGYTIGTDNSVCMATAIEGYEWDAPYHHQNVNNWTSGAIANDEAYWCFYNSDGHRGCWEAGKTHEYGIVTTPITRYYYIVMTSASFDFYTYMGNDVGFVYKLSSTVQKFEIVYYTP